ncbi:tetratricopeptide repeat protein [Alteromonas facilis]|uniref:surface lipoprotein assembly modifier n=1 Tax=Alteromonas facilis TaxID=2048004 RepID=UPI0013DA2C54|nr:tetratricopeptide repeat protein [Alteromonas facilis]
MHVNASEKDVVAEIRALLERGQNDAAYSLALANAEEFEGSPEFDLAYGLSARANGDLHTAVFAFERVLQINPQAHQGRLALGVAYYELGNYQAAKRELTFLTNIQVNDQSFSTTVSRYLQRIEQRQSQQDSRVSSLVQVGVGHDSNPNNGVEDEFIVIPSIGTVTLFDESVESDSMFIDVMGAVSYASPLDQHSSWYASGSVTHAEYEDEIALSRTFMMGSLGYRRSFNDYQFDGAVFYRPLRLDGDAFLDYYGALIALEKPIADTYSVGLSVLYSNEDYSEQQGFDKDQFVSFLTLQKAQKTGRHKVDVRYGLEQVSEAQDFLERTLWGLSYEWFQRLSSQWEYRLSLEYTDSDYQGVHPLFLTKREDNFLHGQAVATYRLSKQWSLLGKISYLDNDSNIDIYQYQRVKVWLGASYEF